MESDLPQLVQLKARPDAVPESCCDCRHSTALLLELYSCSLVLVHLLLVPCASGSRRP
jgi:hypothetical protein